MEKLEHPLWIVSVVNAVLGPLVLKAGEAMGHHFATPHEPIPPFLVMVMLIVLVMTALSLFVRSRLSVEQPGSLQVVLEDVLRAVLGLLEEWIGPKGHRFVPLIATLGIFILLGNYMGLVPGLMAPTSSIIPRPPGSATPAKDCQTTPSCWMGSPSAASGYSTS